MNIFLNFKDKEFSRAYQKEVDVQNSEGFRLVKWFVVFVVIVEYSFKIYERIRDHEAIYLLLDFILVVVVIGGYILGVCIQRRSRKFDYMIDLIYFLLYCYGSFYITYDLFTAQTQTYTGYEFVIMGMQSVWIQLFFFIVMKNWIFKVLLVAANILIISLRTINVSNYNISAEIYLRAAVSAIYTIFLLYISEKIKRVVFIEMQKSRNKNSTFSNIIKNIPEMILMLNPDLTVAEKNNLIDKFFKAEQETNRNSTQMEQSNTKEIPDNYRFSRTNTELLLPEATEERETEGTIMKSKLLVMRLSSLHRPKLRDSEMEKAFFKLIFADGIFETVDIDAPPRPESARVKDHNLYEILRGISRDIKGFKTFLDKHTGGEFIVIDMKYAPDLNTTQERGVEVKIAAANFSNKVSEEKIILILRDTTQRDLIARLEDNNQYKDALLASVSHELRTPLNTNINSLESIVSDSQVPEEVKELYAIPALKNGRILLNIINDILDLSQISSQSIKLYFEPKNLKETLQNCLNLVEYQAKRKGLQINLNIEKGVPEFICTDHARLSQVVLNLLNNSVKFTYEGMINVRVEAEEDSSILFSFEDTGIGLDEETISKLRNMLSKMNANERIAVRSTGAGLGLNVSNLLAKMLGPEGKAGVTFESIVDKGSKFYFRVDEKPKAIVNVHVSNGVSRLQIAMDGQNIRMKSKQLFEIPSAKHFNIHRTESIVLPVIEENEGNDSEANIGAEADFGQIQKDKNTDKYDLSQKMLNSLVVLRSLNQPNDFKGLNSEIIKSKGDTLKGEKIALLDTQEKLKLKECTCCQVMVVDDEPFNVMTLEQLLSRWKKKCVTAFNGKDALNKLRKKEGYKCDPNDSKDCKWVRLILMDKNMPIMDGIETTKEISKMIENHEIDQKYVVGNTAYVGQKEIDAFLGAGLQEILFKPLDKTKLEKIITKYLDNKP